MVIVLTKTLHSYIIAHVQRGALPQNTPNVTFFKFMLTSGQNKIDSEPDTFTYYKM